ncbi:MAG: hypothetical protein ACOYME_07270 [Prochlorotrichaceae cyanobacterium]
MGGIDRLTAAKIFQESLSQFEETLPALPRSEPEAETIAEQDEQDGISPPTPQPPASREEQLAIIADAIADLEEFLNSHKNQKLPGLAAPEETP